jgi:hypothetical protein
MWPWLYTAKNNAHLLVLPKNIFNSLQPVRGYRAIVIGKGNDIRPGALETYIS